MTGQLIIVLIVCALLLLLGLCFIMLAIGVFLFLRAGTPPPGPMHDVARVQDRLPHRTSEPPLSPIVAPPPPPELPSNLGMLLDDVEEEGAKTEVFTRGSLPMDWDDDEGEATEIFRPELHGALDGGGEYEMD